MGIVESFFDLEFVYVVYIWLCWLIVDCDDDLLVVVFEEVIYLLDIVGEMFVDFRLCDVDGGVDVIFVMIDVSMLV